MEARMPTMNTSRLLETSGSLENTAMPSSASQAQPTRPLEITPEQEPGSNLMAELNTGPDADIPATETQVKEANEDRNKPVETPKRRNLIGWTAASLMVTVPTAQEKARTRLANVTKFVRLMEEAITTLRDFSGNAAELLEQLQVDRKGLSVDVTTTIVDTEDLDTVLNRAVGEHYPDTETLWCYSSDIQCHMLDDFEKPLRHMMERSNELLLRVEYNFSELKSLVQKFKLSQDADGPQIDVEKLGDNGNSLLQYTRVLGDLFLTRLAQFHWDGCNRVQSLGLTDEEKTGTTLWRSLDDPARFRYATFQMKEAFATKSVAESKDHLKSLGKIMTAERSQEILRLWNAVTASIQKFDSGCWTVSLRD